MECENGVHVDESNGICEEPIAELTCVNDQNGNVNVNVNVNVEKVVDVISATKSGGVKGSMTKSGGVKGSKNDVGNEVSKISKESSVEAKPRIKVIKEQVNGKGLASSIRNQKVGVSQSLSFPSKSVHGGALKKSIDASVMKTTPKQSISNGKKSDVTSERSLTSDSVLDHSDGKMSIEVTSKEVIVKKAKASTKQSSTTPIQSTKPSVSVKSAPKSSNANEPTVDVSPVVEPCSKPVHDTLPANDDETKGSTESQDNSAMRKGIASGFAFRLDDRAEKRKEFNMKIEEKIHAKEAEKSTIQAKSKESQEAEIKQLRKSLNFKAAPMPTFYKEPPPKVELKKIPITRPKSPKLGRCKSSTSGTATPPEGAAPSVSPRVSVIHRKVGEKSAEATKKSATKSQSKLQPRETVGTKSEEKNVKSKPIKKEVEIATNVSSESDNFSQSSVKEADTTIQAPDADVLKDGGIANMPNNETMAGQIMVGG